MSIRKKLPKSAAFSLVETMVVLAMLVIVLSAIYGLLYAGERSWHTLNTKVHLQATLRNTMDTLADELRQSASSQISISADGKSITFSVPVQPAGASVDVEIINLNTKGTYPAEAIQYSYPNFSQWGSYTRLLQPENRVTYLWSADKTITRRVTDSAGGVVENFVVANNVESLNFSQPVNSDRITLEVSGEQFTIKQLAIAYNVITSVHYENDSF